jgi:hypothetical protein
VQADMAGAKVMELEKTPVVQAAEELCGVVLKG